MIYIETSVALAHLFAEDRRPPALFWTETLVSSRLLEYEVWTRLHARKATQARAEAAREVIARISLLELTSPVLARALDPFPVSVRAQRPKPVQRLRRESRRERCDRVPEEHVRPRVGLVLRRLHAWNAEEPLTSKSTRQETAYCPIAFEDVR